MEEGTRDAVFPRRRTNAERPPQPLPVLCTPSPYALSPTPHYLRNKVRNKVRNKGHCSFPLFSTDREEAIEQPQRGRRGRIRERAEKGTLFFYRGNLKTLPTKLALLHHAPSFPVEIASSGRPARLRAPQLFENLLTTQLRSRRRIGRCSRGVPGLRSRPHHEEILLPQRRPSRARCIQTNPTPNHRPRIHSDRFGKDRRRLACESRERDTVFLSLPGDNAHTTPIVPVFFSRFEG